MIKVGNILIDPYEINSISCDYKQPSPPSKNPIKQIVIVYKNGVVKNFTEYSLGVSYEEFIDAFIKLQDKKESDRVFRLMTAIKSTNYGSINPLING